MFAVDFGFGQLRLERLWLEVYDFNAGPPLVRQMRLHARGIERTRSTSSAATSTCGCVDLADEWAAQPRRRCGSTPVESGPAARGRSAREIGSLIERTGEAWRNVRATDATDETALRAGWPRASGYPACCW
jgi:hypothetical protein